MYEKDILIVDDDIDLSNITKDVLDDYGYTTDIAHRFYNALNKMELYTYRLLILDINLPEGNGFEFCEHIRKESNIPILFISARTSSDDKVKALEICGDDYLSKPYQLQELLARVNAQMRRNYDFKKSEVLKNGDIQLNVNARTVTVNDKNITLSLREFDILEYFMRHINQTIHKEALFNAIWGSNSDTEISTLAVHIRWIREKIENDRTNPVYITTIWRVGYRMEKMNEK